MRIIRPFLYDRAESYFAVKEIEEFNRYVRMRSTLGQDEWYDLLPHREGHREIYHRYNLWNYDDPFYRSHGKRGRIKRK